MEKKTQDITSLINKVKLAPEVEKRMGELRPQILEDLHLRITASELAGRRRRRLWNWSAAASVALLLVLGILFFVNGRMNPGPEMMEYMALAGERTTVTLPDGTEVELNGGSCLSYDKNSYGRGMREVHFEGEAFFDVTKNPDMPFVVHNGDLDVRVLGTRFNVDGYASADVTRVTLESGKVDVSLENGKASCILEPGQQSVFYKDGYRLVRRDVNVADITSWLSGGVFFEDADLAEVARRLEASFGTRISVSAGADNARYNGAFCADDDMDRILTMLTRMNGRLHYTYAGDSVSIYSDKQSTK